jgi:hypothetical protein
LRANAYFLASSIALAALNGCTPGTKLDPNTAAFAAVSTATGAGFKSTLHNNVKFFQSGAQHLQGPQMVLEKVFWCAWSVNSMDTVWFKLSLAVSLAGLRMPIWVQLKRR